MRRLFSTYLAVALIGGAAQAKPMTFVVDDPGGRNVASFRSKAPIEVIVGSTNAVTGKITFDPSDLTQPATAEIKVDLRQVDTGIELRNEHMRGADYLNTDQYPYASFTLNGPVSAAVGKLEYGSTTEVTLKGEFAIHGETRDLEIKGQVGFYPADKTLAESGFPGEILTFDGRFMIKLGDFNIKRPQFLIMKLAEEQDISISFTAASGR